MAAPTEPINVGPMSLVKLHAADVTSGDRGCGTPA